jgi:hypothetical protein
VTEYLHLRHREGTAGIRYTVGHGLPTGREMRYTTLL